MKAIMSKRATTGLAALAIAAGIAAGLTACAEQPYPDLGTVNKVDNVLTPVERDDTIKDLAKEGAGSPPRH